MENISNGFGDVVDGGSERYLGQSLMELMLNLSTGSTTESVIPNIVDLIEKGADVNVRDPQSGMSPLHIAAALGCRPVCRALVSCGKTNYLLRDASGRYAFELAIEWAQDYALGRLLIKKQGQQAVQAGVPAWEPR